MKEEIYKHKYIIYRDKKLTDSEQLSIAKKLGNPIKCIKHPSIDINYIYRISNDNKYGFVGNGTSGYHNDNIFLETPSNISMMYCISNCKGGVTHFVPIDKLISEQNEECRSRWKKIKLLHTNNKISSLIYKHPITKLDTMLFHTNPIYFKGYYFNDKLYPVEDLLTELQSKCEECVNKYGIKLEWKAGDLVLFDNLSIVHFATKGVLNSSNENGLRLMNRISII